MLGAKSTCLRCQDSCPQLKSKTLISQKTSFLLLISSKAIPPAPRMPPPSKPTAFPSLNPTKKLRQTVCFQKTCAIQVNSFLISLTNLQTRENRQRNCGFREERAKTWCRFSARSRRSSRRSKSSRTACRRKSRLHRGSWGFRLRPQS